MYPEPYKDWIDMFNDDLIETWKHERKELQKIALLLCAFEKELKYVQNNVNVEVSNLKQQLKYKENLENELKSVSPRFEREKTQSADDKENVSEKRPKSKHSKNNVDRRSPDLFRNQDLNDHCSSTDISIIDLSVSSDDTNKSDGSPTIKKRRKRFRVIPNPKTFSIITETDEKTGTPPGTAGPELVKVNLFKTPVPKPDHDVSVIECTPEIITRRSKTSTGVGSFMSKKKNKGRKSSNTTLTQIFKRAARKAGEDDADSDETYYEDNTDRSKMGITDLIHYINKDDSTRCEDETFTTPRTKDGGNFCQGLQTSSQEVDEFSKGAIFNEEDIQTSSEKPKVIIEPEPVVRGKARKQLHGWSCQQCKDFYGQMKLPPHEMQKKMDECSRHRFKYNPPEETMPGFWDLSIPPESTD